MTFSISAVAACCSKTSSRSRVRPASFLRRLAIDTCALDGFLVFALLVRFPGLAFSPRLISTPRGSRDPSPGPIRLLSPIPDQESPISSALPSIPQEGRSQIPDAPQCARKVDQKQRRAEHTLPRSILHEIDRGDWSTASFSASQLSAHC